MWRTSELTARAQILAYLETDRFYAAYAIGDLEPGMYEQCTWAGAERAGALEALVLHYHGLEPPPLLLIGEVDGLRSILERTLCPERVHLTCREEHVLMTREFYDWEETTPMWRMVLQPERFRSVPGDAIRLTPGQSGQLAALYALGGGSAFSPMQVAQGVFFGLWAEGQLVAAAGTHLVSPTYGVGAVGNVFVHPDYRGLGRGTAATSAVVTELLERGIRDVVLNVGQENTIAVHVYEKLGFERYCPFLEGPATKRAHRGAPRRSGEAGRE